MRKDRKMTDDTKQYIMIDITDINNIKSDVNIEGLQNQLVMIDCLSQTITQISHKSKRMSDLIIENIRNFKDDDDAEVFVDILKQVVGNKDSRKWQ